MEKEGSDEMEVAAQANEKRKEKASYEIVLDRYFPSILIAPFIKIL